MKIKKGWAIGGGVTAAAVAALLIVPSVIDWSKYQTLAQQKVAEATGYNLAIGGALRIGLLPSPHASVENVSVKKPNAAQPFLTFESANVHLALLPLLTGHIEISSVTLDKPVVTLQTAKDGTDNWKPVTKAETATQVDGVTGAPVKGENTTPSVSIGKLNIKDGQFEMRDDQKGTTQQVGIKELTLKADSLAGPFDGEGTISYGQAKFDVDVTTSGYREGESLKAQIGIDEKENRLNLKWSGVATLGDNPQAQGELNLSYTDIVSVLNDIGMQVALPIALPKTKLNGIITASADSVVLTNGAMDLGGTQMSVKFSATGLKTGPKSITALIDTPTFIDVDALLKTAEKVTAKDDKKKEEKAAATASGKPAVASYDFLPASFELPKDVKADLEIKAKGLDYQYKKTGPVGVHVTLADGKGDLKASVASLPGGGALNVQAIAAEKGKISGTAQVSVDSLQLVLSDWLGVVKPSVFENPSMPRRIDTAISFDVAGRTASVNIASLSIGETSLSGSVSYTNGPRPVVFAKASATLLTLPEVADKAAPSGAKSGDEKSDVKPAKADFSFEPPQLPFDLKFDVALARLARGDTQLADIKAAGTYNGKGVTLTTGSANVNGGTVSVTGSVADLKALSGVDMQAGLTTSDLEGFVKAATGKPLALSKTIGAFAGSARAKGDKSKLDVNGTAKALGFTIDASGILDNPMASELPGNIQVRVRHADFVQAMRAFSPGFGETGSTSAKPIDVSGLVKIAGQKYEIENLKGVVGNSDIAGTVKADMSGSVPSYTAKLTSSKLDIGSLVGVESKTAKATTPAGTAGASSASAPSPVSPWSREALDTGFLKAMNLDISVNAASLLYGTWALSEAKADVTLKDGVLKASPVGKLYGGSFDASLNASAAGDKAPVSIDLKATAKDVEIGSFLAALTASNKRLADGTGSVDLAIKGSGTSSAALVSSLTGKADIKATKPVIYGMDIDKFAADIVEAFDGGWKGVLAGFASNSLSGGTTSFKDISHSFPITGGDMPVKDFTLETLKGNATVVSNGDVNFANFQMDIQSSVKVTQPKDTPVIGMRLAGPLNNPSKSINSQALDSLIRSKVGDQVQKKLDKVLGDKLKGTAAEGLVNQFLGGGSSSTTTPTPAAPAATDTTPANTDVAPAEPTAPATEAAPQQTPQQQLLNGLINQFGK